MKPIIDHTRVNRLRRKYYRPVVDDMEKIGPIADKLKVHTPTFEELMAEFVCDCGAKDCPQCQGWDRTKEV